MCLHDKSPRADEPEIGSKSLRCEDWQMYVYAVGVDGMAGGLVVGQRRLSGQGAWIYHEEEARRRTLTGEGWQWGRVCRSQEGGGGWVGVAAAGGLGRQCVTWVWSRLGPWRLSVSARGSRLGWAGLRAAASAFPAVRSGRAAWSGSASFRDLAGAGEAGAGEQIW